MRARGPVVHCLWAILVCVTVTWVVFHSSLSLLPRWTTQEQWSETVHAHMSFYRHETYDVDPRGVSASSFIGRKRLPIIPMHFLWWSRGEKTASFLFHLVIFRTRGDYLWHGQLSPETTGVNVTSESPSARLSFPFPTSSLTIGQHSALIDRFAIRKEVIGGLYMSLPANISSFLRSLQDGALVECNHAMARYLVRHYDRKILLDKKIFRQSVQQMLAVAAKILDKLGITFWLSSGTLLGWYRQCDVIPYTRDADIEIRIEDYTPTMIQALEEAGLRLMRRLGKIKDCFELTFKRQFRLDIFFRYEEKNYTYLCMFHPSTFEKYRYIYPKYSLRWADFGGVKIRVPYPPEDYLVPAYGKEWYKPKPKYNWLRGASNWVKVGAWPKEERVGLKQTFL
ncbi:hypothetical protein ACOMHN_016310 [Nucella lapillus]